MGGLHASTGTGACWRTREIWHALGNTLLIAVGAHRGLGRARHHRGVRAAPLPQPPAAPPLRAGLHAAGRARDPDGHEPAAVLRRAAASSSACFTIFLAHVTFCVSYVAMVVLGRLQDFDCRLVEAAQDLGADWWTTTRRVLLPLLAPGIARRRRCSPSRSRSTTSSSPSSWPAPARPRCRIRIYSMIKHGSPPLINALSTILLVVTFVAVWLSQRLRPDGEAMNADLAPSSPGGLAVAVLRRRRARSPPPDPARLHLGRLHQARARAALRAGATAARSSSTPSTPTRPCTPSSRPAPRATTCVTPSSYMVEHHGRSRACCSRSTTRSCRTWRTSTPTYLKIALDPQMKHSVPYMLTNTGLAYLKSKVQGLRSPPGPCSTARTSRAA